MLYNCCYYIFYVSLSLLQLMCFYVEFGLKNQDLVDFSRV